MMATSYPQKVVENKPTIGGLNRDDLGSMQSGMSGDSPAQFHAIGARLQRVRETYSDLSQVGWAEKHGFGVTQWNNWERGVRRIPVDDAERLCAAYGLTLDFIYLGRRDGLSERASKAL